jgi:hypothetical protein
MKEAKRNRYAQLRILKTTLLDLKKIKELTGLPLIQAVKVSVSDKLNALGRNER